MKVAISEADVVVCVFDGTLDPLPADREAVELLRRSKIPVLYVANKIDNPNKSTILGFAYMFLTGTSNSGGHRQVHGEFISFTTELPGGNYEGFSGSGPKIARVIQ